MSAFKMVRDMYDDALKPRLLTRLLREDLLDAKRLNDAVRQIQTFRLLSESSSTSDQNLVQSWKSALDGWVNYLMTLLSHNSPDKCWVGISLLGLTCKECSTARFLASYTDWFHKLLSCIELLTDSQLVKAAFCASISDLITRLGGLPNSRKDGALLAEKVVQSVLKFLNQEDSEAIWEAAVYLLCIILSFFPTSVRSCHDSAEAAIVRKMFSGKCSDDMLKKLAHCMALIPKSKGDELSWCLMMQRILLHVNVHLNDIFHGLEEENAGHEVLESLLFSGQDKPPPLGGHEVAEEITHNTSASSDWMISIVSVLILCCGTLLKISYPIQVKVPIRSLLALVKRILRLDGSVPSNALPYVTSMQQEIICLKLPILHWCCLDLLVSIIQSIRSQLLPHAWYVVQFIQQYFRRCALPELRIKVYKILRTLLISLGVGISNYIAQELVHNAILDLKLAADSELVKPKASSAAAFLQPCNNRKRKHRSGIDALEQQRNDSEVAATDNHAAPVSLKIAALQALETLLTVGGAMKSEPWRATADLVVAKAADSYRGEGTHGLANTFLQLEEDASPSPAAEDVHLAALRALLASLLSQTNFPPPQLAKGSGLFSAGKRETGTKAADFCAGAVLALDVLLHPRAPRHHTLSAAAPTSIVPINYTSQETAHISAESEKLVGLLVGEDDLTQTPVINQAMDSFLPQKKPLENFVHAVVDLGLKSNLDGPWQASEADETAELVTDNVDETAIEGKLQSDCGDDGGASNGKSAQFSPSSIREQGNVTSRRDSDDDSSSESIPDIIVSADNDSAEE